MVAKIKNKVLLRPIAPVDELIEVETACTSYLQLIYDKTKKKIDV